VAAYWCVVIFFGMRTRDESAVFRSSSARRTCGRPAVLVTVAHR